MTPPKLPSLSVFFPAYNDGGTIASMVITARTAARQITDDFELIVIDDGSRDYTPDILNELVGLVPELRVIRHQLNQGYGSALKDGFAAAKKQWVFYTDGDAQYNPMEMIQLAAAVQPNTQLVNGYKITRKDPLIRIILGSLYNRFVKIAFNLHLRDIDCDFRLIKSSVFDSVHLDSNTGVICVEMIKKFQDVGIVYAEVPVHHYHRQYGTSQFFTWRKLLRVARQLLRLWWRLTIHKGNPG